MSRKENLQIILEATQTIWGHVFTFSDQLIAKALQNGLEGMNNGNEPILDRVVERLNIIDKVLELFSKSKEKHDGPEEFEIERLILNSKQQVLWVRQLALHTAEKDQEGFDKVLQTMRCQGVI